MTTSEAPAVDLFGTPLTEDRKNIQRKRPKVAVPESVLQQLKAAREQNKRLFWKLRSVSDYENMANILYSAGDLMDATILPVPVTMDENGNYTILKKVDDTATHISAIAALRRGNKKASPAE